ncbi:hypothetical protein FMIA91_12120 [Fidelibacter multiformis]
MDMNLMSVLLIHNIWLESMMFSSNHHILKGTSQANIQGMVIRIRFREVSGQIR